MNHEELQQQYALASYGNTKDNPLSKRQQQAAEDLKEIAAQGKAQHYLLPPEFLKQVTAVLELGASKHGGSYNWRKGNGIREDVYISATFRHLLAIMEGQWLDPESGKSHWSHIAATAAIMVDAIKHDKLKRQSHE